MDYEEVITRISTSIRTIRKQKKLTVQELAYRCDIERSNLSRIEAGRTNLTIKTIVLICNALQISMATLLAFDPSKDNINGSK